MATAGELRRELSFAPSNGSGVRRQVLAEVGEGVRSAPEAGLRQLTGRSSVLPHVWWNPKLATASGGRLPTPDGYIEEAAVALEVDSRGFHLGADGWAATLDRTIRWAAAGIAVLHLRR